MPKDKDINFIIDRKAVIDIMEDFSKSYKKRQESLHLDTLIQIENIVKEKRGKIKLSHCYSHITDNNQNSSEEIQSKKMNRMEKLIAKYGKEKALRYIEGNKEADKMADKSQNLPDLFTPILNQYHNKYVIKSTRKKKTKKIPQPQFIINSRIRNTIKDIIRKDFSDKVFDKNKYKIFEENKEHISGLSTDLLRDKTPDREHGRKMMMRMIHGTLPTCEKLDRLVYTNKTTGQTNEFYAKKYLKYTNNGMCPCCNAEKETIQHLFYNCENNILTELREDFKYQPNRALSLHLSKVYISGDFVNTSLENNKEDWDIYLGILGIIPTKTIKNIKKLLNDETKHKLHWIISDISRCIMEINIKIWQHRCKLLYGNLEIT